MQEVAGRVVCDAHVQRPGGTRPGRGDRPFEERINDINRRAAELGREPIPFTVSGASTDPKEIEGYQRIGAKRAILRVPPAPVAEAMPVIKQHAELVKQFS